MLTDPNWGILLIEAILLLVMVATGFAYAVRQDARLMVSLREQAELKILLAKAGEHLAAMTVSIQVTEARLLEIQRRLDRLESDRKE